MPYRKSGDDVLEAQAIKGRWLSAPILAGSMSFPGYWNEGAPNARAARQRLGPGDRARSPSRRLYEPEVLGCTSTLPEKLWFLINEVSTPSPQTAETAVPPSCAQRGNAVFCPQPDETCANER
jgi:hypothetical protein